MQALVKLRQIMPFMPAVEEVDLLLEVKVLEEQWMPVGVVELRCKLVGMPCRNIHPAGH
jgi:hypothetical protein